MKDSMFDSLRLDRRVPLRDAPWYATALFALVFFAAIFRFGTPSGVELDPSWATVLGWSQLHGVRWGQELIFSYGPLGWLHPRGPYNPDLFTSYLIGQALLGLGYTFIFANTFRSLAGAERWLFALLVLLPCRLQNDVLLVGAGIFALVALDRFVRSSRHSAWGYAGLGVLALQLNALALMKFTLAPLSVLLAGTGLLLLLRERRAGAALGWLALWMGSALVLWLAHGQALADLPLFLRGALMIVAGYGAAMGVDSSPALLVLGLLALAGAVFALLVWLRREPFNLRSLLLFGFLAFCLYLAWRNAYTRADIWHVRFFFPLASFVVFALLALAQERLRPRGRVVLAFAALLCMAGVLVTTMPGMKGEHYAAVASNLTRSVAELRTRDLRARYEQQREVLRQEQDLPSFRALVGTARVDLFGCTQGALLLNKFNYAPRPVFQSYAAYTEPLQRINEAYYLGAGAPEFVIVGFCPIDRHVPSSEDGLALLALLRAYRPVAAEKGYVLLRREAGPALQPLPGPGSEVVSLKPGEWVDLPRDGTPYDGEPEEVVPRRLHLHYELSALGRLYALLLREPVLLLETQGQQAPQQFRLVRPVAGAGFLISPLLLEEEDYLRWYYGLEWPRPQRIRVTFEAPWQERLFKPQIGAVFTPVELPRAGPAAATPAVIDGMYPGFSLLPVERVGSVSTVVEDGRPVLFMHAPSYLDLAPAAGSYALETVFGVRAAAYASADCAKAGGDGIGLRVVSVPPGTGPEAELVQYERNIDPFRNAAERGPQTVRVERVDIAPGRLLRVSVTPGVSGANYACDWGYISAFRLQALPAAEATPAAAPTQ
jgi:hypothetical protein